VHPFLGVERRGGTPNRLPEPAGDWLWGWHKPLGYGAGDANFYRYVGNAPTLAIDPSGLIPVPPKDETLEDIQKQEYACDRLLQSLDLEIILYRLRIGLLNNLLKEAADLHDRAKPLKNKPLLNAVDNLGGDIVNDLAASEAHLKNLKLARSGYLATKCKIGIDPKEAKKARDDAMAALKRADDHYDENPTTSYSDTIDILDEGIKKLMPQK
jgi:hypothetical protein